MNGQANNDVVVIGAGITGLATAYFLQREGARVTVVEKSGRPGGVIRSVRMDGFLFEHGPSSMPRLTPFLDTLFTDLEIRKAVEFASANATKRYIVRRGRLVSMPLGPRSAITTALFSTRGKLRVLREPFVRASKQEGEESLANFVKRRLGEDILDYAVDPFVAGVFAGVPEQLSVKAAFPKLYRLEQRYGSLIRGAIHGRKKQKKQDGIASEKPRMFSFKDGMETIVNALASRVTVLERTDVRSVRRSRTGFELELRTPDGPKHIRCGALVLTIPAHAYDSIDFEFDFQPRLRLARVDYPPVTVVFFGFQKDVSVANPDGFGFLVPEKERRAILGTIWNSSVFSHRAPAESIALTTFVGGRRQPDVASIPDGPLVEMVRSELRVLMGITQPPDVVTIKRWTRAIPQYVMGHLDIIGSLEQFERETPGFYTTGSFRGGISMTACIENSRSLSRQVLRGAQHHFLTVVDGQLDRKILNQGEAKHTLPGA